MRRNHALLALALLAVLSACEGQSATPAGGSSTAAGSNRWAEVEKLVREKDLAGAYAALEAMRVAGPADPDLVVRLAEVRRLQGEQAKAILLLREAHAADPKESRYVVPLSSLYLQVAEVPLARDILLQGRANGADTTDVALLLGQAYGMLDELDLALAEFDRAGELGAKPTVVLYNKALVLGQKKKHAEAIAALEKVVETEPTWPAGRRELARAILDSLPKERAPVDRALDLLIGAQAELPEDWRLHESIGDAWLLLGDFDAAIQAYTEALRHGKNPKSVEDRYRVAVTKQRERDSAAVPPPKRP